MSTDKPADVLFLKKEGGKKITIAPYGSDVVITVWRKNDGVLLPLVLNRMEAQRLAAWITAVVNTAAR
jgi:hypothetical protein